MTELTLYGKVKTTKNASPFTAVKIYRFCVKRTVILANKWWNWDFTSGKVNTANDNPKAVQIQIKRILMINE